jgi:hypothetical protein
MAQTPQGPGVCAIIPSGPTFSERMRRSQSRRWSSERRRGDLKSKGVTRLLLVFERNGNCYILCHKRNPNRIIQQGPGMAKPLGTRHYKAARKPLAVNL